MIIALPLNEEHKVTEHKTRCADFTGIYRAYQCNRYTLSNIDLESLKICFEKRFTKQTLTQVK